LEFCQWLQWRAIDPENGMTININLPPQLQAIVRQKVASGRYASPSEVVREALRLLEQEERHREAKLEQFRKDIDEGLSTGIRNRSRAPRGAGKPNAGLLRAAGAG
jgi:antitoxin ParD1/3/4